MKLELELELKQFLDIMTKHYVLHLPVNLSMLIHYKTTKWPPLDYNEQKTVPWIIYCGFTLKGHQAIPWSLLICQRLIGLGFVYFSSSAKKRCTRWQIVVNWNQLERAVYPFVDLYKFWYWSIAWIFGNRHWWWICMIEKA